MKKEDFIKELVEELEIESKLTFDTDLKSLDEWDSMTVMMLIGYVSDSFDVKLTAEDIEKLTTVDSLVQKIGENKFD